MPDPAAPAAARSVPNAARPVPTAIEAAVLRLTEARGPAGSICPSDVARALAPEWRPLLSAVRRAALRLAAEGRIDVLRKGEPVSSGEVRGVIRLRAKPGPGGA